MDQIALKQLLDEKAAFYNHPRFLDSDPVQLPHRFTKKQDIEIVAFLAATIAWGNRKSIITSGERIIAIMGGKPHEYICNYEEQTHQFVHRTFNGEDLNAFFVSLKRCYSQHESLEEWFLPTNGSLGSFNRINHFREQFTAAPFPHRTEKHLANPMKGSSAKRLNMFLRWMVRSDANGVDFGLWNRIPKSELHLPLDVHTGNVARKLGILTRTQNDWKSVAEIQEALVELDPEDPCKYDFALFGLGVFEGVK